MKLMPIHFPLSSVSHPRLSLLHQRDCHRSAFCLKTTIGHPRSLSDLVRRWSPERELSEPDIDISDRKSTRLNSSHVAISYAVFCLKKKNKQNEDGSRQKCAI